MTNLAAAWNQHRRQNRSLVVGFVILLILATAAFAGVHLSDPRLALFALVAGAAWSFQFARWGNLWALGLSHGVLAGLAYPLLLGGSVLGRV